MKIPEFKPSKHFLGDTPLPCLIAKVKNSELPGVASRYIAEFRKDPMCEIYLLGKEPQQINAWQQTMLEQLFEKEGLAPAITEGMKDYETNCIADDPYEEFEGQDRQQIREGGIASFVSVHYVVIDALEEKTLLSVDIFKSDLFGEHGVTLHLNDGRWCFEDGDYLTSYPLNQTPLKDVPPAKLSWLKRLFGG